MHSYEQSVFICGKYRINTRLCWEIYQPISASLLTMQKRNYHKNNYRAEWIMCLHATLLNSILSIVETPTNVQDYRTIKKNDLAASKFKT